MEGAFEAGVAMLSQVRGFGPCRRPRCRREGSEAGEPQDLAPGNGIGDGREHSTEGRVGAWPAHGRSVGHAGGKVGPVHPGSPSGIESPQRITLPTIVRQRIPHDAICPVVAARILAVTHFAATGVARL